MNQRSSYNSLKKKKKDALTRAAENLCGLGKRSLKSVIMFNKQGRTFAYWAGVLPHEPLLNAVEVKIMSTIQLPNIFFINKVILEMVSKIGDANVSKHVGMQLRPHLAKQNRQ